MSTRLRGEHDTRWSRWRPSAPRAPVVSPDRPHLQRSPRASSWRLPVAVVCAGAAIAVGGVAAGGGFASGPTRGLLPASPRAWLDAYEAAAVDNPSRVCSELFAPQLAAAYGKAMRGSCTSYFERITSFSVAVRGVLRDGDTAVLELRQTVRPRDWTVVLSRRAGGWEAVDLLPGDLVR